MTKFAPILAFATFGMALTLSPAQAAVKWDFSCGGSGSSCGLTHSRVYTEGSESVTVSAFASYGSTSLVSSQIGTYGGSGVGVVNPGESTNSYPGHSMDNGGSFDVLLFEFGSAVSLSDISAGWYTNDSDVTVLAFTGADPFDVGDDLTDLTYGRPNNIGQNFTTGTDPAWTLINNYDLDSNGHTSGEGYVQSISTAVSSTTWLVGAYNSGFGGCNGCSSDTDNIKLLSLAIDGTIPPPPPPPGVPAPGSLMLFALALMAPALIRRRRGISAE